jgi:LmbE family N-acetylglucosaminyl deacetylase
MSDPRSRIARQAATSAVVDLWRALVPLRSVASFYQTGAHPDDESTRLLARLALKDGARVGYVCALRGEGGQNAIGPEVRNELGVVRTGEMEAAARVVDLDLHWLSFAYDDPVFDFGFSKTGEEAFAWWGEDRVVERLVRVIRTARPDVLCPTFLDVPGQHGHHRAMTRAAERAFEAAGDPAAFRDQIAGGLAPWRPAKFYLPAWSGAGDSYDDEVPPPPATCTVEVGETDPVLGATYAQIAQWSRAFHASQGMGRWVDAAPEGVPLHRLIAAPGRPATETHPFDGLLRTLADLADGAGAAAGAIREAQAAADAARAAWPDGAAAARAAARGIDAVRRARAALTPAAADAFGHRLAIKERQFARAMAAGLLVRPVLTFAPSLVAAGGTTVATLEVTAGGAPVAVGADLALPAGWTVEAREAATHGPRTVVRFTVRVPADAAPTGPYRPRFDPLGGDRLPEGRVTLTLDGTAAAVSVAAEEDPAVVPPVSLTADPDGAVLNLAAPRPLALSVAVRATTGSGSTAVVAQAPAGWTVAGDGRVTLDRPGATAAAGFTLSPGPGLAEGLHTVVLRTDGALASAARVREIGHPHTGRRVATTPATVSVRALRAALPDGVRIGFVDGGSDRAWLWLRRLGLDVTLLSAETLASGDLSAFDTIVTGIFAFGKRPDLAASAPRLGAFVEAGGTLVTQYHRPSDGWDPNATPPRRIRIGQPSLRWRVTDQSGPVTVLAPGHPLLTTPNRIGPDDWAGWVKERGLYFAAEWDAAYVPLLAMNDPGEAPLTGGLLAADIGRGRHVHTALVLHTQMEALVPGAFRLFANLVAPRR